MDKRKLKTRTGFANAPDHWSIMDGDLVVANMLGADAEKNATELTKRHNAHPELINTINELLRHCVTPKGFPDKGKGRTDQQQAALDNALKVLKENSGK